MVLTRAFRKNCLLGVSVFFNCCGADEAEHCLPAVEQGIEQNLPARYAWPGNYRELEQCVRNVIMRRSYLPLEQLLARFRSAI
jgi:DNA-binding NtrC family response regulator